MFKKMTIIVLLLLLAGCTQSNTVAADNDFYSDTGTNEASSSNEINEEEITSNDNIIVVESIEPYPMDSSGYASCDISFRNTSGQRIKTITLNVAYLNEKGDIIESTYPQYPSSVEDGQACVLEVLYEEIPHSLQIASVSYYDMRDNYTQLFFESPYIFEMK